MSTLALTKTKLREGTWEGLISAPGEAEPQIEVLHHGLPIDGVALSPGGPDGAWVLRFGIPQAAISDGLQTLVICDRSSDTKLGFVSLMAGEALGDDLRAEVDLLRAELDMLKRAFRRHCLETS